MKEYSVWVDEAEKIVSFHEVDNSELIYFDQREIYLAYLSALTTQGYRFQWLYEKARPIISDSIYFVGYISSCRGFNSNTDFYRL